MLVTTSKRYYLRIILLFILFSCAIKQGFATDEDEQAGPVISSVSINSCVGSITISVTSGVLPYSYEWKDSGGTTLPFTSFIASGLTAGNYTVEVRDGNGDTTGPATYTVTNPPDLVGTVVVNDVTCRGDSDAQIVVTMGNGNPGYDWELFDGGGTSVGTGSIAFPNNVITITGLGIGNYTLSTADQDGCTGDINFSVTQPANFLGYSIGSSTDATCFNSSDGSITATGTGGWGAYTYQWIRLSDNAVIGTAATITGLAAGDYRLDIIDRAGTGCTISTPTLTIDSPPEIVPTATISNALCNGDANGAIDLSVAGGVAPYSYSWSNGATTQDISGLAAGNYTVTITDNAGCTDIETFTVTEPNVLTINPVITDVDCFGDNSGRITSNVSGGTGPYTYAWSTGNSGTNLNNRVAGTYSLTVTDANGCVATAVGLTVAQPAMALSKLSDVQTDPACFGNSDGSISITMQGGTGPYGYSWSNGDNTATATGLNAGIHTVTVTDANGCTYVEAFTLTDPARIAVTPALTLPTCNAGADGSITVAASNGTGPYTYNWNTGDSGPTINGLVAGTYTVTVADAGGCSVVESIVLGEPSVLVGNATVNDISCNGSADGSVFLAVSGGTGPYTYAWNTGATTNNITGLAAGGYSVTITDASGCSIVENYTVIDPAPIGVAFTQTNIVCKGATTGGIDITPSGGTAPYSYLWSNGATTQDLANVAAGSYSVTVRDASNCSVVLNVTITEPALVLNLSGIETDATCNGANNGSIDLTVTGGAGPYTYSWNTGATTQDITGLAPGNYSATVTDANGCIKSIGFTISEPAPLAASPAKTDITCNGANDGSITVGVSGGTGPYTYSWADDGTITTNTRTSLTPGNYTVTVTDANGCIDVESVTITEPAQLTSSDVIQNVSCFGESTGAINLSIAGGTAPYSFSWSNGALTEDLTNIPSGSYSVVITDANGCTINDNFTITQPSSALSKTEVVQQITCNGAADGIINLTVTGGSAPYTYNWSNGSTSEDLNSLSAGSYTVTITDNNGCTINDTYVITDPPVLGLSGTKTDVTCFGVDDGTVDITVTGGEAPYTYAWSNGASTEDVTGLSPGNYTINITDARGCTTNQAFNIQEPTVLSLGYSVNNVTCFGDANGAIDITVSGGTAPYNYVWSNASTNEDLTGLSAASYTVTVTDANGCTLAETIAVTQPAATLSTTALVTDISCFGGNDGSLQLTPAGGTAPYTYSWNTGSTNKDIFGLSDGSYQVTITDANGCSISENYVIAMPPALIASGTQVNVLCNGDNTGSIDLSVSGGTGPYTYTWSNGANTEDLANVLAGNYNVTIADARGCAINRAFTITQPLAINVVDNINDVACFGDADGSIDISVSGGIAPYTYSWSGGETTQDLFNLSGGNYTLTVTDANGCQSVNTYTVNEPTSALAVTGVVTDENCFGDNQGGVQLTVTGGSAPYTYSWNQGATTKDVSGLGRGTYQVTVTDNNGCLVQENFTIAGPSVVSATSIVNNVTCNGAIDGTIDLQPSGGVGPYTFLWSDGLTTEDRSGLSPANYSVTITDANGCTAFDNFTITEPLALNVTNTIVDVLCFGDGDGSIDVSVSGGVVPYTYSWSGGETTQDLSSLSGGSYTLTVTDANGCQSVNTFTVNEPTSALAVTGVVTDENCFGDNQGGVQLTVTGGSAPYNYAWNTGATTKDVSGLGRGNYQVTITDNNGCVTQANYTIAGPTAIVATAALNDVTCNGASDGTIDLQVSGGVGPYTFLWSDGLTTEDRSGLSPANYSVTITDANGCTAFDNFTITEPLALNVTNTIVDVLCFGDGDGSIDVSVSGGVVPYTYSWSGGETTQDLSSLSGGSYTLTVTDANGCQSVNTFTVNEPTSALAVTGVVTDENCFGDNQGGVQLTVTGGSAPYNYAWNTGATTKDVSGLGRGNYQVTITDNNGCVTQANYTIAGPTAIVATAALNDVTCNGASDGTIDLQVSGGVGPYTYLWADGTTTEDRSGLSPANYGVTITDANGCTTFRNYVISEPTALTIGYTVNDVNCFGEGNGSIAVTVTGGSLPYTYSWSSGETTKDLINVSGGAYTLTVTDGNGCQLVETITVAEPSAALGATATITDETCFGDNQGAVVLNVSGGTAPYSYSWNQGSTSKDIFGLSQGTYQVTITDSKGCSIQQDYTVSGPMAISLTANVATISCNGSDDGTIDLNVAGGTGPFTFAWSNGSTSEDLSGLAPGTYAVLVTDVGGCTSSANYTITEPLPLSTNFLAENVSCFGADDGSIDITVSGGTLPYTYSWDNGATTADLSGLSGGDYQLTVTDASGCQLVTTVAIGAPSAALSASSAITNSLCNGQPNGKVELTVTGGTAPFNYSWSNGSNQRDLVNVFAGDYSVTITDAGGCVFTETYTVGEPDALDISFEATSTSCFGDADGSVIATASGGTGPYSYVWSNGRTSKDLVNISGGTYNLTIVDSNNCSITRSVLVGDSRDLTVDIQKQDVLCKGSSTGFIQLDVTGGSGSYTYTWDTGQTTDQLVDLNAGVYEVLVSDEGGCSTTASIVISEPAEALTVTLADYEDLLCYGDQSALIRALPQGGVAPYTYLWSNGERTSQISGLGAGIYSVAVTDANGCLVQQEVTIAQPAAPITINTSGKLNLSCNGERDGSISIDVTGGTGPYDYLWSTGDRGTSISGLNAGDYTVRVKDANDCVLERIFTVSEPEVLTLEDAVVNESQCYDDRNGSIELNIKGGTAPYTYQWNNGATTKNLIGISSGSYDVLVTDANGCQVEGTYTLAEPELYRISPEVSPISCVGANDASISLNIEGGIEPIAIRWNTGANTETLTNLSPGVYNVLVTDKNGCTIQNSFNIFDPLPLTLDAYIEDATKCNDPRSGLVNVIVSGGAEPYSYRWTNGSTESSLIDVLPGTYVVEVTDRFGCTVQGTYTVLQPEPLQVGFSTEPYIDCANRVAGVMVKANVKGGVGNYRYRWSREGSSSNELLVVDPGRLTIEVLDERGCFQNRAIDIDIPELGLADFEYNAESIDLTGELASNDPVSFFDQSVGEVIDWKWEFGDGFDSDEIDPIHTYDSPGVYEVILTVTDRTGCQTVKTTTLEITEGYRIMVPTAFTPNGDGNNDFFRPRMLGLTKVKLIIYNTWGEVIFSTDDVETKGWDGTVKGKRAENGNYVFKLIGESFNGLKVEREGIFALMK